jgi:hypothetical protein
VRVRPPREPGEERGSCRDDADRSIHAFAAVGSPVHILEVQHQRQFVDYDCDILDRRLRLEAD